MKAYVKYENGIKKNRYSVYLLINPINNIPFYVGYTSDVRGRYKGHMHKCPRSKHGQLRWKLIQNLLLSEKRIEMKVIQTFGRRSEAMKHESEIIGQMLYDEMPILNYPSRDLVTSFDFHMPSLWSLD